MRSGGFGTMRIKLIDRLNAARRRLPRDNSGNVLMIMAAAIVPLLGMIGSGVDISRAYMAQLRLQQACDAGALAGRRAMAAGQWGDTSREAAERMFYFNYPRNLYGSKNPTFSVGAVSNADVSGTATATLPTIIMHMWPFGKQDFDLKADCTAKLEISNTDVMLVLDVTGSMAGSRIDALREAALAFFDTITKATAVGDGRLRIGMVPYSTSANVGFILMAKNKNWISDYSLVSSRSAERAYYWNSSTDRNAVTSGVTYSYTAWENILVDSAATDLNSCNARPAPEDSLPVSGNSPSMNSTGRAYMNNSTSNSGAVTNVTASGNKHSFVDYRYNWDSGKSTCFLQKRDATLTLTRSIAAPNRNDFVSYRYANRVIDVAAIKSGFTAAGANNGKVTLNSAGNGGTVDYKWSGCLIERRTKPTTSGTSAPAGALDLDVDLAPSDIESRWMMAFPEATYNRTSTMGSTSTTLNPSTTTSNYPTFGANEAWGTCPSPSKPLTTMTKSDRSTFAGWVTDLKTVGGTYHDAGMIWGVRLISPDGMFKNENETAPNQRPIGRHIIFMTDGQMDARAGILSHQGYEMVDRRVSGSSTTSDGTMKSLHGSRFVEICRTAKAKNITVWVIAFAEDPDSTMGDCATANKLYISKTKQELSAAFADIAGQISRLRLSK
jgi:Flp pilus assembly protein TadG